MTAALAAGGGIFAVALIIGFGLSAYIGSPYVFGIFNLSFLLVFGLIFPRPRLYVYTFFAAFLCLGFWMKVIAQTIWSIGFIEPVGNFTGTAQEWDAALLAASCGATGVIFVRFVHILAARRATTGDGRDPVARIPAWFLPRRRSIWTLTIALTIVLNVVNSYLALYQVGINPMLILPLRGNVAIAWLINIGMAMWISTLVYWDFQANPRSLAINLLAPIFEAFLSSISVMSRLFYLLHAGPYWFAVIENWKKCGAFLRRNVLLQLVGCFFIFFALSILVVFWLRVTDYYEFAKNIPPNDSVVKHFQRTVKNQLPHLFVHRWVGLEGVLAVGAVPHRGSDLFLAAMKDDPKLGSHSLYQRVANVHYLSEDPVRFTFLANPGVVAVLLFSNSLIFVALGMALITVIMVLTEHFAFRLTGNPFLLAVTGCGLANIAIQMTFPYLSLIFFLQLWVALGFLAAIERSPIGINAMRQSS